jgi:AcrR family transcriptional regulator
MRTRRRTERLEVKMAPEAPADIREQILNAAERVIDDAGLGAATTRAIAQSARCAEGSIYRYFPDKHALLVEVIRRRYPQFLELVVSLPERAGTGTVRKNLEEVAAGALAFYRGILPTVAGTLAERKLLTELRESFTRTQAGPMKAFGAVTSYLRKEQRLGRLSDRPSAEHLTRLLLGACFTQAFLEHLLGDDARLGGDDNFARGVVRSLMEGMIPRTTVGQTTQAVKLEATR